MVIIETYIKELPPDFKSWRHFYEYVKRLGLLFGHDITMSKYDEDGREHRSRITVNDLKAKTLDELYEKLPTKEEVRMINFFAINRTPELMKCLDNIMDIAKITP